MEEGAQEISRSKKLMKLFFSTLYLSAFTFGGGYVIVTLMQKKFVEELHWIDEGEMLDLVAIAQSSPGAIAVNGAIVVGYKLCGFPGILVSVFGAILPPFLIISLITAFYQIFQTNFVVKALLYGMRSGVSAVIISVVIDMGTGIFRERDWLMILVMVLAFIANFCLKINVVYIILASALLGMIVTIREEKRRGGGDAQA